VLERADASDAPSSATTQFSSSQRSCLLEFAPFQIRTLKFRFD
jgi:hypothetical protein